MRQVASGSGSGSTTTTTTIVEAPPRAADEQPRLRIVFKYEGLTLDRISRRRRVVLAASSSSLSSGSQFGYSLRSYRIGLETYLANRMPV